MGLLRLILVVTLKWVRGHRGAMCLRECEGQCSGSFTVVHYHCCLATNDDQQQDEGVEGEKEAERGGGREGERERGGRRAFSLDLLFLALEGLHSFSGPPDPHVSSLSRPPSY